MGIIKMKHLAYKIMINSVEVARKNEIGGILVGKKEGGNWIITHCITDYEEKKASKGSVEINTRNMHNELIYIISKNMELDYIGEWHKHPKGLKEQSYQDYLTMKKMIKSKEFGKPEELIMVICCKISREKIELTAYEYNEKGYNVLPVEIEKRNR